MTMTSTNLQIAESLLHHGALTYRQISQLTNVSISRVKAAARDVALTRAADLHGMRHLLFLMQRASTDDPEHEVEFFVRFLQRAQRLLYHREMQGDEMAALKSYAADMGAAKMQDTLTQLHLFSTLPDMQLLCQLQQFVDGLYAQVLRDTYDCCQEPAADDPDPETCTAAPPANGYIIPDELKC